MSAVPISIVPFVIFLAVCAAFAIGYEIIRFFEKRAARKAQAAEPEQCEPPVNGTFCEKITLLPARSVDSTTWSDHEPVAVTLPSLVTVHEITG